MTMDSFIAYISPNTLTVASDAFSTMKLLSDLGTTGLERRFRRFEDSKGPKCRLPWQSEPISQSPFEVLVGCMLIFYCVLLAGREGSGATFLPPAQWFYIKPSVTLPQFTAIIYSQHIWNTSTQKYFILVFYDKTLHDIDILYVHHTLRHGTMTIFIPTCSRKKKKR